MVIPAKNWFPDIFIGLVKTASKSPELFDPLTADARFDKEWVTDPKIVPG